MKKTLIVYYSFEGNTHFVSRILAKELNADILRIKPKDEIKTHGFFKYIWGGKQVIMRQTPKIMPIKKDLEKYDAILIGTPVWSFNYSPPIRSFFSENKIIGKKIGLFCTHEGAPKKTLKNMENEMNGNSFIGKKDFFMPLKNKKDCEKEAISWAKKIKKYLR